MSARPVTGTRAQPSSPLPDHDWLPGGKITDPSTPAAYLVLLRCLFEAGRRDLAAARLMEGHIDALQLIRRYGGHGTGCALADQIERAGWCGVWNADLPGAPLRMENGVIRGGKAFASGAGHLSHALVTLEAGDPCRVQLVLVNLDRTPPETDTGWWDVAGMQASHTHKVSWEALPTDAVTLIGRPGDYAREPWFSGGVLRYSAAQAGGLAAVYDGVRNHLLTRERDRDPHQRARLARLYAAADIAATICRESAERWFKTEGQARLALMAHARLVVADQAQTAISLAQEAIGLDALFRAHPVHKPLTDLMVYIRQPGPDRARDRLGEAAALGALAPDL